MIAPRIQQTSRDRICAITGFHDGHLSGVRGTRDGAVLIWCANVTGDAYVLRVPDVCFLKVWGFTGGNIICDINIYDSTACPLPLFARVSSLEGDYWRKLLPDRLNEFVTAGGFLLEITTSDGCELLALSNASPPGIAIRSEHSPNRGQNKISTQL
jgi:hypothetical protein